MNFCKMSAVQALLLSLCTLTAHTTVVPQLKTTSGLLHGIRETSLQGTVVKFLGVPYAVPPVNNLRFMPPQEFDEKQQTKTVDATNFGPACRQPPHLQEVMSPLLKLDHLSTGDMSEDCLFLNVYVPESVGKNKTKLPVMVWLAGEGFDYADARQFDGTFLALKGNVIVVTVNYRVSVFGFLTSLTEDAPGNVGLLDQRMALRWVKKNIDNFGGDSSKVTLFGRFSGSMSVSMQITSPLNKEEPLFQRAILQSGIALKGYVFDYEPITALKQMGELAGCNETSTNSDLVSCLKGLSTDELMSKSLQIAQRWKPVIDGKFLKEEPLTTISEGTYQPVDGLFGINNDEGSMCLLTLYYLKSAMYQKVLSNQFTKKDFEEVVKSDVKDFFKQDNPALISAALELFDNSERYEDYREKYIDFCGSMYIKSPTEEFARELSRKSNVFFYEFVHRPSSSIYPEFIRAANGDDVLFSLGLVNRKKEPNQEEIKLSNTMISTFANFAKNGSPSSSNLDWPSYNEKTRLNLKFSTNMGPQSVQPSPYDKDVDLWFHRKDYFLPNSAQELLPAKKSDLQKQNFEYEISKPEISPVDNQKNMLINTVLSVKSAETLIILLIVIVILLLIVVMSASFYLLRGKYGYVLQQQC